MLPAIPNILIGVSVAALTVWPEMVVVRCYSFAGVVYVIRLAILKKRVAVEALPPHPVILWNTEAYRSLPLEFLVVTEMIQVSNNNGVVAVTTVLDAVAFNADILLAGVGGNTISVAIVSDCGGRCAGARRLLIYQDQRQHQLACLPLMPVASPLPLYSARSTHYGPATN